MTLLTAVNISKTLDSIKDDKIPVQLAFKIAKIHNILASDIEFYYERLRSYIDMYCEKNEDDTPVIKDGSIFIKKEVISEFNKKVEELNNLEAKTVNINLTLDELSSLEKISPSEISMLMPIISE